MQPATIRPIKGNFQGVHINSIGQFSADDIMAIINEAGRMQTILEKDRGTNLLVNYNLVAMMAQDSSRTGGSFAAAMDKLGGKSRIPDLGHSSMNKNEDFEDTATCLATQADVLVIRTPENGGITKVVSELHGHQELMLERGEPLWDFRIINAGDGTNEHPTQALVDLYTIYRRFGRLEGLEITMVGALAEYRATNSLALGASLFGMKVNLVMPDSSPMQEQFRSVLEKQGCLGEVAEDVRPFLRRSNVIYVARTAKEYIVGDSEDIVKKRATLEAFLEHNRMTADLMKTSFGPDTILMHPLPRNQEIDKSCDHEAASYYISQMKNGIPIRMALLALMFGKNAA